MAQKYTSSTQKKSKNNSLIIVSIVVIILVLAGGLFWYKTRDNVSNNTNNSQPSDGSLNLNPPTEQEIKETQQFKDELEKGNNSQQTKPNSTDGINQINPVIVSISDSEVTGYIPGIFEEGGTCTATFTKDSESKEFTSTGFGNVSNTNCEPIAVSGLSKGSWTVTLSYESMTSKGTSEQSTLEVN